MNKPETYDLAEIKRWLPKIFLFFGGIFKLILVLGGLILFSTAEGLKASVEEYDPAAVALLEKIKKENIQPHFPFYWAGTDYGQWAGLTWSDDQPRRLKGLVLPDELHIPTRGFFIGSLDIGGLPDLESLSVDKLHWLGRDLGELPDLELLIWVDRALVAAKLFPEGGFLRIRDLPALTALNVGAGDGERENFLADLATLPNLQYLNLAGARFEPEKYNHLTALKKLRTLILDESTFGPDQLHILGNLPELKELSLKRFGYYKDLSKGKSVFWPRFGPFKIAGLEKLRLTDLDLSNNKIEKIENLENLTELKTLNLRDNSISIVEGLENMTQLESLDLLFNQISAAEGLEHLISLKTLKIGTYKLIERLPSLPNLEELHIYHRATDKVGKLDDLAAFGNLKSLKNLKIQYTGLEDLNGVEKLSHLQRLEIIGHRLKNLEALSTLTGLEYLQLTVNDELRNVKGLAGLTNLTHLDLHGVRLADWQGLGTQRNLKSLNLAGVAREHDKINQENLNGLNELASFSNLKWLDFSGNTKITNYAGLKGLYNLEYLDLSENKLEKVDMLDGLTSLEVLNLNKNPLSDASGLAQASRSLKEIYLDVSDINSLKWLEHLSGLNILSAKEAKLSGPIDLSFWPGLQRLDLSYNAITGLSELKNLPVDFVGLIANNRLPLSSIYELMEDGKKSGRQWLFTMGGEKQGTLRELEVRRGVGDQNDVFEPQALKVGETLDLRTETHLGGRKTDFTIVEFDADNKERGFWKALDCALVKPGEKRGFGAPLPACLKDDAGITFWRAGRFKIRMENKAIVQPQTRLGIRLEEMCIAVISSLVTVR